MDSEPGTDTVREVLVIRGYGYEVPDRTKKRRDRRQHEHLASAYDAESIAEVHHLLTRVAAEGGPVDWGTHPTFSLVFIGDHGVIREYGIVDSADWIIRPESQFQDSWYPIADPHALRTWLRERGVETASD